MIPEIRYLVRELLQQWPELIAPAELTCPMFIKPLLPQLDSVGTIAKPRRNLVHGSSYDTGRIVKRFHLEELVGTPWMILKHLQYRRATEMEMYRDVVEHCHVQPEIILVHFDSATRKIHNCSTWHDQKEVDIGVRPFVTEGNTAAEINRTIGDALTHVRYDFR